MNPNTVPLQKPRPKGPLAVRAVLLATGTLTVAALALLYVRPGLAGPARSAAEIAHLAIAGLLIVDRTVRLLRSTHRGLFLRSNALDFGLLAAATAAVLFGAVADSAIASGIGLYLLLSRTWLLVPRGRLRLALNVLLAATGAVAVAALVLEYGFREPLPVRRGVLHAVETIVVALFVLDRIVRLEFARDRRAYLRENWVDFALLAVAAAVAGVGGRLVGDVLSAGAIYVIITQAYILVTLLLRAVSVNLDFAASGLHPTWLLIGSFAVMCLGGSGLLMLPVATPEGMQPPLYYDQALFTATSATCVTGLIVRDTAREFTAFGQAVILVLIQLGGLGIMLFGTVLAMLVGKGLSVRSSTALGEMMGTKRIGRLGRAARFVVAMTLAMELLGAVLLYPMFAADRGGRAVGVGEAVWHSVFHSVSAFCNAGFALYSDNMMAGVADGWAGPLRDRWQVLGVMAPLIVLGGLGFPVLQELGAWLRQAARRAFRRGRRARAAARHTLSLHSKIVLTATAALLVLGAGGLLVFGTEREPPALARHEAFGPGRAVRDDPDRWANMPLPRRVRAAVFQSVTARTAGFNTIDMAEDLSDGGRLWLCLLMCIGGSPASTAGGMKTVTFAVLVLAAWSVIRRRGEVEAFRRSFADVLLRRVVTLAVLYAGLVVAVTLLLCTAMPDWEFLDLLFEACSACGTVGLSTGVTGELNLFGRVVVIAAMFAGRLGPLTLLLALTTRLRPADYAYPSENVVIG